MQIINPTVEQMTDYILDQMSQDEQDEFMGELREVLEDQVNYVVMDEMDETLMQDITSSLHCGPAVLSDSIIVDTIEFMPTGRFLYQGYTYYTNGSFAVSLPLHNERLAELLEDYEENSK